MVTEHNTAIELVMDHTVEKVLDNMRAMDAGGDESLKAEISRLETQRLELYDQVTAAEKQSAKLREDLSRVGSELQTERQARVAAEERAVSAESALREIKKRLEGIE